MNGIEIPFDEIEIPFDDPPVSAPPQAREQPSHAREIPHSRRPEEPTTLHWVCDVERAFVALVWHHPQYVALVSRELDFEAHISVPPYRQILKAISIVHGEIGEADFVCVIHCLRELGAFEEAGGIAGLNEIYTDGGRCCEGYRNPEVFFREYLKMIKEYALARRANPYSSVKHYTGGRGFLQRNKLATKPTHPSVIGRITRCCCGKRCTIAGWPTGEPDTLNLTLDLER